MERVEEKHITDTGCDAWIGFTWLCPVVACCYIGNGKYNSQMMGNSLTHWATVSFSRNPHTIRLRMYAFWIVTWYDFRCRIPECDGKEAVYEPEWLRYAVPYKDGKPSSCSRYPLSSTALESTAGPLANNETSCSPDMFDNSTTIKCRDWVFATEEWTIANEVTLVYMSDRFRPYIDSVQLNSNSCHSVTVYSVSVLCVLFVRVVSKFQRSVKQNTEVIIQIQRWMQQTLLLSITKTSHLLHSWTKA